MKRFAYQSRPRSLALRALLARGVILKDTPGGTEWKKRFARQSRPRSLALRALLGRGVILKDTATGTEWSYQE